MELIKMIQLENNNRKGLALVVDEFGKFVEYIVKNNSANSSSVNRNTTSSSNNNTKSVKSMKSYSEPVNSVDDKVDEDK